MAFSLTPALRDFAVAVAEMTEALGRPPTYQEIADDVGYASKSTVFHFAKGLYERGWLEEPARGKSRLVLTRIPPAPPEPAVEITAAGRQALAEAWVV